MRPPWRGTFTSTELNALHAEGFGTRLFTDEEWNWRVLVERHSPGWVVAHEDGELVGFINVLWDGFVHAWLQDVMVALDALAQVLEGVLCWQRPMAHVLLAASGSTSISRTICELFSVDACSSAR